MNTSDFERRLRDSILVADGGMGSMLYEAVGPQRCFEEVNASQPEAVFQVHQAYIEAGAHIIETNTFGANRRKLAPLGLAEQVAALNHRGVKLAREAREAAAREVLIAGSVGPLGLATQMHDLPLAEMESIFREQAAALEERGVDLFVLETFPTVDELLAAVAAIRAFSNLPIVAHLTFSEEGVTIDGAEPLQAAHRLKDAGVQAIGANCTLGPQLLLPILHGMAGVGGVPLSAMPNAGFPKRQGDRIVYPKSSPEYFASFAREAAAAGARIVGGCCGTTPNHIRAMAEAVSAITPSAAAAESSHIAAISEPRVVAERSPESALWKKIQAGRFVVSVEIDPPRGTALDRIFEQVERVMACGGVDTIDINSGSMARVGMDSLMLAAALEARGVETIPHVTTRDTNLIGLQAALIGAWSVGGVRNILAITGDPPSVGGHPEMAGVFEIDAIGLVKVLAHLNQGTDWAGKTLGGATNYSIGVALNPLADDLDREIERFHAKVEAGAHYAMTQPLFDPDHWRGFLKRIGGRSPIPVLVGVWPLNSYKQAVRLNNEVPGIVVPDRVLSEMESAGASARDTGFALAREMLDWARTEVAGAYLVPPFKRYEEVLTLLG